MIVYFFVCKGVWVWFEVNFGEYFIFYIVLQVGFDCDVVMDVLGKMCRVGEVFCRFQGYWKLYRFIEGFVDMFRKVGGWDCEVKWEYDWFYFQCKSQELCWQRFFRLVDEVVFLFEQFREECVEIVVEFRCCGGKVEMFLVYWD